MGMDRLSRGATSFQGPLPNGNPEMYSVYCKGTSVMHALWICGCRLMIGTASKQTTRLELHFFNNCLEDEYSDGMYATM